MIGSVKDVIAKLDTGPSWIGGQPTRISSSIPYGCYGFAYPPPAGSKVTEQVYVPVDRALDAITWEIRHSVFEQPRARWRP